MRPMAFFPLAFLAGCIIYDTDGKRCEHCGDDDAFWEDTGGLGDRPDGEQPGEDSGVDEAPAYTFTLTPGQVAAGDTVIASLTVAGEFNLGAVTDLEFVGDGVVVLASSLRQTEMLLTVSVDAAAPLGAQDLLLYLDDGQVALADDALTVLEAGSTPDYGTGDGGGTGGTDDGSTGGDDGTGGTDDGGCG